MIIYVIRNRQKSLDYHQCCQNHYNQGRNVDHHQVGGEQMVIDGQQRTTSTMLFLARFLNTIVYPPTRAVGETPSPQELNTMFRN